MRTIKNKLLKQSEKSNRFSVTPIFGPVVLIAIAIGVYYFLTTHSFFPLWIDKIYIILKIIIVLEIIIGSARTIIMPLLTLIVGIVLLYLTETSQINLISMMECWQLIFVSVFGFLISFLIKF